MPARIISSAFTIGSPQADGQVYVTEVHSWDSGLPPTFVSYGPVLASLDFQAVANARAAVIMQSKRETEAQDNVQNDKYLLVYNTQTEMLTYLRDLYQQTVGWDTCKLAQWILDRLAASAFPITAIRSVWGLTQAQWNSFNGVLDVYGAAYSSVNAARGTTVS